jgi:predicted transcriptional regulator
MNIVEMTADLVHAMIRQRSLSADSLSDSLHRVHGTLLSLALQERMPDGTPPTAPVDWRQSITRDTVMCIECGKVLKQLGTMHLRRHGLNTRTYRARYGIPRDASLSARELTQRRRQAMKELRPWELSPHYRKGGNNG